MGRAQSLPAPWQNAAIGDAAPVSAHASANGSFTSTAAGRDIQDAADAFGFIFQPVTGDVTLTAQVVSVPRTNEWAKAGIMIRAGSGADAMNIFFAVTSAHHLAFQHRDAAGSATTTLQLSGTAPLWLRLQRIGTQVTAFTSPDGATWTLVSGATSFLPPAVAVGLASTSHQAGVPSEALFDHVAVSHARVQSQDMAVIAQVICHGDSLTAGYNASSGLLTATGTTYPGVLARALGPAWRVTNIGTGGWPLGALIGEASTKVDPLFDPSLKENVLIVFGGTNDLGGGHKSAKAAYADLITYCRARRAAHPWRILVVTPPVAAYPGVYPADFDAQMVDYDALIRRNWRFFADGIVDAGGDPRLGTPGAEHNPTYFSDKDFTHLTDAGYAIVGKDAAQAVSALPPASVPVPLQAPRLAFQSRAVQSRLGAAYEAALENLLRTNTVPDLADAHNASGMLTGDPAFFIRAGGGYDQPWTRDASLNSWNAASLLEPQAARNTLWAVCQHDSSGALVIQQDSQWWDKVIWMTGAWNHYAVTGDRAFLKSAYGVAQKELAQMQSEHFSAEYGLFQGPAFFTDGIAGYPEPEYDPNNHSSFVLDHHYTAQLMALSTNCVYYNAFRCASRMATELKQPALEARQYEQSAAALKSAINSHLWIPSKSTYGYFLHGAGPLAGTLDPSQEGIGLSFAILFGVASPAQAQSILHTVYRSPHGITASWPHFARFDDAHPGRHNGVVWPLVNGMFATAAASAGRTDLFRDEVENAALLSAGSDHRFFEIYNGQTGVPDGGWQNGGHWPSQPDQTWSATAYLRMINTGLFGMEFAPNLLTFAPTLPAEWGSVKLTGVRYRSAVLTIALQGSGSRIVRFLYDGRRLAQPVVSAQATGPHSLVITLK